MKTKISDLLAEGLLIPGDVIEWHRKKSGQRLIGSIEPNGKIKLEDGRVFDSPSGAACKAAGIRAVDGWTAWSVKRLNGKLLDDLRAKFEDRNLLK